MFLVVFLIYFPCICGPRKTPRKLNSDVEWRQERQNLPYKNFLLWIIPYVIQGSVCLDWRILLASISYLDNTCNFGEVLRVGILNAISYLLTFQSNSKWTKEYYAFLLLIWLNLGGSLTLEIQSLWVGPHFSVPGVSGGHWKLIVCIYQIFIIDFWLYLL